MAISLDLRFVLRPAFSRERLGPNLAEVLHARLRVLERRVSCLALEFDLDRYRSEHKQLVARQVAFRNFAAHKLLCHWLGHLDVCAAS